MLLLLLSLFIADPGETFTRSRDLRIHYEVHDERTAPCEEVVLFAREPGRDWAPIGRAKPGDPIRASLPGDGIYHLDAVAVGTDGSREVPGPTPEAVVIVDSTPPNLSTSRVRLESGRSVRVDWKATDRNISPDGVSVRLEMAGAEASWKSGAQGRVVISLPRLGERCVLRLVARDRCGNEAEEVLQWPELEPLADSEADLARLGAQSYAEGRSLLSRKMWKAAEDRLEKAVALAPDNGRAWNDLGVALHRLGRAEEAREALKKGTVTFFPR